MQTRAGRNIFPDNSFFLPSFQVVTVFLLFGAGATFAAAVFAAEKLALSLRERKPARKI